MDLTWLKLHVYNCLKLCEVTGTFNEVFRCWLDVPEFQLAATSAIVTSYEGFGIVKQHMSSRLPRPYMLISSVSPGFQERIFLSPMGRYHYLLCSALVRSTWDIPSTSGIVA